MSSPIEKMSDDELRTELGKTDLRAPIFCDLLIESWRRHLPEAKERARAKLHDRLDKIMELDPTGRPYDMLEIILGVDDPIDAQGWMDLSRGYEQRLFDVLMLHGVQADADMAFKVLDLANAEGDSAVISRALCSLVASVSTADPRLPGCLLRWYEHSSILPNTKVAILRRLAEFPWTEELEDFFVRLDIENDGTDASITDAINEALRRPN